VPIDHEHVLDSDSILSMLYLPRSLTVLGSGVIACEYATIFGALGTKVTMIDKYPSPMGFLDAELTQRFVAHFESELQCRFLGDRRVEGVAWNGVDAVETTLDDGEVVRSEKLLCAQGRAANVVGLDIESAGLVVNAAGLIDVNAHMQTTVPHIYAVGDVIGAPALASTSMEQGRRAICHALGVPVVNAIETIPVGIYTIPEMSCVGLSEAQARDRHGEVLVGRANFSELARGQISCCTDGLLKLVSDPRGAAILGVQIFGEGATELIHVGQMGLLGAMSVDVFIESIFNFPTLAEAYRVAALDIMRQRAALSSAEAVSPAGPVSSAGPV
jgi:NAD(P) transhydrogenase